MHYKVGTRKSALARVQTAEVIRRLTEAYPEDSFEEVLLSSTGDRHGEAAVDTIGGKGIFVDEIEAALLDGRIQFAVHSMKDLPAETTAGLCFARAWRREDARDVLLLNGAASLAELPEGAVIAAGSRRRAFQLKMLRPDIQTVPIRGNVGTRIRRLREGMPDGSRIDGLVLAAAGLRRLGRENEITQYLSVEEMIPAPAQGVLAIELRAGDQELYEKLNRLSDAASEAAAVTERAFLSLCGGGCTLPVGAFAEKVEEGLAGEGKYRLRALFGNEDGSRLAFADVTGAPGETLAEGAMRQIRARLGE